MKAKASTVNHMLTEELIEQHFKNNLTDDERHFLGEIDCFSPSRAMIQKESSINDVAVEIREDAEECSRKLNFLNLAREASVVLHRENANAGLKVMSAMRKENGETLEAIGVKTGRPKETVRRHAKRFVLWSKNNAECFFERIAAEDVVALCSQKATRPGQLADILDSLRIMLIDLMDDLLALADDPECQHSEAFSDRILSEKSKDFPVDITELFQTI